MNKNGWLKLVIETDEDGQVIIEFPPEKLEMFERAARVAGLNSITVQITGASITIRDPEALRDALRHVESAQ